VSHSSPHIQIRIAGVDYTSLPPWRWPTPTATPRIISSTRWSSTESKVVGVDGTGAAAPPGSNGGDQTRPSQGCRVVMTGARRGGRVPDTPGVVKRASFPATTSYRKKPYSLQARAFKTRIRKEIKRSRRVLTFFRYEVVAGNDARSRRRGRVLDTTTAGARRHDDHRHPWLGRV